MNTWGKRGRRLRSQTQEMKSRKKKTTTSMMIMNIKMGSWLREKTIAKKMVVNNNQQGVQTLQPMRSTKTIRMVKADT